MAVTHERDGGRVAAEWFDVLFDPVQRGYEIQQGVVSRSVAVAGAEETWKRMIQAVIPFFLFVSDFNVHVNWLICGYRCRGNMRTFLG